LVFNTLTDPYLQFAFWIGAGAFILTLMLAGQIFYLRIRLGRHARHEQACIAAWRPLLNAALMQAMPDSLPSLSRRDRLLFLKLWIHLKESVRGDAGDGLNTIAYRLQCDVIARRLLRHGSRAERLLAILVLGHLRDRTAWNDLQSQAAAAESAASLHALWALVQIDPAAATEQMADVFLSRDDWPLPQLVNILQDAGDACVPLLLQAVAGADPQRLPRILRLAEALRVDLPAPVLTRLLRHESVDVLTAGLRLATHPDLLEHVRPHLTHADWRVRVLVAKALSRIGDKSDVERLMDLLNDEQWWVRYRAAHALVDMPFLSKADVAGLSLTVSDRYARDMLKQVLAEKEAL
jgi:HEAT repeat protein